MTTSQTPLRVLRSQAERIARDMKLMERGILPPNTAPERLRDALSKPLLRVGIVMDDKTLVLEITWEVISKHGEVALTEMILRHMRGTREQLH